MRPSRQVTRDPQELEHLLTRCDDLDTLDIKHTHCHSPSVVSVVRCLDECGTRSVNGATATGLTEGRAKVSLNSRYRGGGNGRATPFASSMVAREPFHAVAKR